MPRGSQPGERRGGRQPGTPNKKTALVIAAFDAATSNPDLSPLDFLLGVMRDPSISRWKGHVIFSPLSHRCGCSHLDASQRSDRSKSLRYGPECHGWKDSRSAIQDAKTWYDRASY